LSTVERKFYIEEQTDYYVQNITEVMRHEDNKKR
jgi:hypothetical protein